MLANKVLKEREEAKKSESESSLSITFESNNEEDSWDQMSRRGDATP